MCRGTILCVLAWYTSQSARQAKKVMRMHSTKALLILDCPLFTLCSTNILLCLQFVLPSFCTAYILFCLHFVLPTFCTALTAAADNTHFVPNKWCQQILEKKKKKKEKEKTPLVVMTQPAWSRQANPTHPHTHAYTHIHIHPHLKSFYPALPTIPPPPPACYVGCFAVSPFLLPNQNYWQQSTHLKLVGPPPPMNPPPSPFCADCFTAGPFLVPRPTPAEPKFPDPVSDCGRISKDSTLPVLY